MDDFHLFEFQWPRVCHYIGWERELVDLPRRLESSRLWVVYIGVVVTIFARFSVN
jgi:hypothetical protein